MTGDKADAAGESDSTPTEARALNHNSEFGPNAPADYDVRATVGEMAAAALPTGAAHHPSDAQPGAVAHPTPSDVRTEGAVLPPVEQLIALLESEQRQRPIHRDFWRPCLFEANLEATDIDRVLNRLVELGAGKKQPLKSEWTSYRDARKKTEREEARKKEGESEQQGSLVFQPGNVGHMPGEPPPPEYFAADDGMYWNKPTEYGYSQKRLCNFQARIIADVEEHDGAETAHHLDIEATVRGRTRIIRVPADQFQMMKWPVEKLGPNAIVEAGQGIADRARVAIQYVSGDIPPKQVFSHFGWVKHSGEWGFLHAGGAIGASGGIKGVEVRPPDSLRDFVLPVRLPNVHEGVRSCLEFIKIAPAICVPLFAAIWCAVLRSPDFGIHLVGPTGSRKTALAAVIQRFFGNRMSDTTLPGSWLSTDNALEAQMFHAANCVFTVDDFVTGGLAGDFQELHRKADRVLRGQANGAARQRLRADGSLRPPKPPRCLPISTGEDVPRGESLRGRLLILELAPGEVDLSLLTASQTAASSGVLSQVVSAFIRWQAPRRDEFANEYQQRFDRLRNAAAAKLVGHPRGAQIVANLILGLSSFFEFAVGIRLANKAPSR